MRTKQDITVEVVDTRSPHLARVKELHRANAGRLTGLTPEERFANHKAGIKDARLVKRYGIRLLPELYEHPNPMPFKAAVQMEKDLTEDLRQAGYTVTGGH